MPLDGDDTDTKSIQHITQAGIQVAIRALAEQRITQAGVQVAIRALAEQRISQLGLQVAILPGSTGREADYFLVM